MRQYTGMLRGIANLYSLTFPSVFIARWRAVRGSAWRLLGWFWHSNTFTKPENVRLSAQDQSLALLLSLGMLAQMAVGVGFLVEWVRYGTAGAWEFGAATLLSYPLLWVHIFAVLAAMFKVPYFVTHPKKAGRALLCTLLESQVSELRHKHPIKVVAVVGSVGKTSTKAAIAELLGQTKRVRWQSGNYNDRVTVPLVFFGHSEPNLLNVVAWLKLLGANIASLSHPYPYDVVVVELGTDGPGQMVDFAYLKPDVTVVTAISPEHMEFFGTLDAVAKEELSVFEYSKRVLVNGDDIAGHYLAGRDFTEYSLVSKQAAYYGKTKSLNLDGQEVAITMPSGSIKADVRYIGEPGAKIVLAAAAVADILGVKPKAISDGLPKLSPFAGRMQILAGIDDTILIDDTYNASPVAVKTALDVLYKAKAPQKIALLGNMNELGDYSQEAHEEVGAYCDPKKLDVVVVLGVDAEKWLAPAAKKQGCTVKVCKSPYEAGEYIHSKLKRGAVVLCKGSQNGVFAEEAVKLLLADPADEAKLVRQGKSWLAKKSKQFPRP